MSRLAEIIQDTSGQLSSKRVAAFVALVAYLMAGVAGVLSDAFLSGLRDIVISGLALSVPEHFAKKE